MAQSGTRDDFYLRRTLEQARTLPGYDRESAELGLRLAFAWLDLESRITRNLQEYRLSLSAFNLMRIVEAMPGQACSLTEISRLLLTSSANVTGLVNGLVRRGLVERAVSAEDRRVRLARLLPEGQSLLRRVFPTHHRTVCEALAPLSSTEKGQMSRLLARLSSGGSPILPESPSPE